MEINEYMKKHIKTTGIVVVLFFATFKWKYISIVYDNGLSNEMCENIVNFDDEQIYSNQVDEEDDKTNDATKKRDDSINHLQHHTTIPQGSVKHCTFHIAY